LASNPSVAQEAPVAESEAGADPRQHRQQSNKPQAEPALPQTPPASPGDPETTNAFYQEMLTDWQAPIDFYGKVVDESNHPIAGASIHFNWSEKPFEGGHAIADAESDAAGLFSLTGKLGSGLEVWANKEGYYVPRPGFQSFVYSVSAHFRSDRSDPIIFRLRKKGIAEPLVRVSGRGLSTMRDYLMAADGTPTEVSLTDGRQVPAGQGGLRVEFWLGKPIQPYRFRFTWKCRVTVPEGGLIQTGDEFPFLAPEDGYATTDEWAIEEQNWSEQVEKQYYVKLRDGKFGRVTVRIIGTTGGYIRLTSLVNPSGSRNLEFDETKVIEASN